MLLVTMTVLSAASCISQREYDMCYGSSADAEKIASPDAKHVVYIDWTQCENDIHPHVSMTLFTQPLGEGFAVFTAEVEKQDFDVEWRDAATLVINYSEDSETNILRSEDAWHDVQIVFERS